MPQPIHVNLSDLHASATKVDMHADGLQASHAAAHGRIEAAQPGVPAAAAVALSAAVSKWQVDTTVLHTKMTGHSADFRGAATGYQTTDQRNAGNIKAVGDSADIDL